MSQRVLGFNMSKGTHNEDNIFQVHHVTLNMSSPSKGPERRGSIFSKSDRLNLRRQSAPAITGGDGTDLRKRLAKSNAQIERIVEGQEGTAENESSNGASKAKGVSMASVMNSLRKANAWSEVMHVNASINVPPVARIIWLANKQKWSALDQLLDKLLLEEEKVDLRANSETTEV